MCRGWSEEEKHGRWWHAPGRNVADRADLKPGLFLTDISAYLSYAFCFILIFFSKSKLKHYLTVFWTLSPSEPLSFDTLFSLIAACFSQGHSLSVCVSVVLHFLAAGDQNSWTVAGDNQVVCYYSLLFFKKNFKTWIGLWLFRSHLGVFKKKKLWWRFCG